MQTIVLTLCWTI